jgi:hypothetical protein
VLGRVEVIVQISWGRLDELQEIITLYIILQKMQTTEMNKLHTF